MWHVAAVLGLHPPRVDAVLTCHCQWSTVYTLQPPSQVYHKLEEIGFRVGQS